MPFWLKFHFGGLGRHLSTFGLESPPAGRLSKVFLPPPPCTSTPLWESMGTWGTVQRSRGYTAKKQDMLQMVLQALVGDVSGDLTRSTQRRANPQQPNKPDATKPWHAGKAPAGKCVSCYLLHHSPKCVICRSCASVVVPLTDPKCPPASKVHKADKPATAQPKAKATPKSAPTKPAGLPTQSDGVSTDPTVDQEESPAKTKPVVTIPDKIAKAKAAAEIFVKNYNMPEVVDLDMGDGSLFPTPEEVKLLNQLDTFAPDGPQPNPEVHAIFTKQLEALRAKLKDVKQQLTTRRHTATPQSS